MPTTTKLALHCTAKLGLGLAFGLTLTVGSATAELRAPIAAQPAAAGAQLAPNSAPIPSLTRPEIKLPNKDSGILFAAPSITVKQIDVKPKEFPPVSATQYKVGFECSIRVTPAQKDYSKFPRHTCFIDQPRTAVLNGLTIVRVDSWPSADGVTSKIVMIADKNSVKNPNPYRIRTAFQLLYETTEKDSKPVLKDFVYADGLLKK